MLTFLKNEWSQISTKLGVLCAAVSAGAVAAAALVSPWSYVAFASAAGLILFREKPKGEG
jgi:hypothetical protein